MNPLTQIRQIKKLNEKELELGVSQKSSWHQQYKDSAYVYIGGLPFDLSEGDVICVFSQYGEVVDINLVRDQKTGKSRGFCFLCYEDQRSTVLAVDNLNGIKILGRTIKVDHVSDYRRPKEYEDEDAATQILRSHGVAPGVPTDPSGSEQSTSAGRDSALEQHTEKADSESRKPDRKHREHRKAAESTGSTKPRKIKTEIKQESESHSPPSHSRSSQKRMKEEDELKSSSKRSKREDSDRHSRYDGSKNEDRRYSSSREEVQNECRNYSSSNSKSRDEDRHYSSPNVKRRNEDSNQSSRDRRGDTKHDKQRR